MAWVSQLTLGTFVEVLVLTCVFYYIFLFFRGTRSAQVLTGLVLVIMAFIGLTSWFNLDQLNWLLRYVSVYLAVAFLIIFHPEIRRALAELGKQNVFSSTGATYGGVDHIVRAVSTLSDRRIGALIAIQQKIGTRAIQETGIKIDAPVVPELLASLFFPHTPLHDGGVIIKGNRILAAGCVLPLSQKPEMSRRLGTRHRAAIGMTEETDAVVVVVSEETGTVSVSYGGHLSRGLDEDRLRRFLTSLLQRETRSASAWDRARAQLDLTPEGIAKSEDMAHEENAGA
jgi:diadenylate cyclase